MKRSTSLSGRWALALVAALSLASQAQAATPAEVLAAYQAQAGAPASPERGRLFFNANHKNALNITCATCHGAVPTSSGRHELTDKRIAPLAPSANKSRLTDGAKVEGWFKTNCVDVLTRQCTAQEKADVLSWLISLQ